MDGGSDDVVVGAGGTVVVAGGDVVGLVRGDGVVAHPDITSTVASMSPKRRMRSMIER